MMSMFLEKWALLHFRTRPAPIPHPIPPPLSPSFFIDYSGAEYHAD